MPNDDFDAHHTEDIEEPKHMAPESGQSDAADSAPRNQSPARLNFEDLTLTQLLSQFVRSPIRTWRGAKRALASTHPLPAPIVVEDEFPADVPAVIEARTEDVIVEDAPLEDRPRLRLNLNLRPILAVQNAQLLFFAIAILFAIAGTSALLGAEGVSRIAENTLDIGAPYLWLAFILWLIGEFIGNFKEMLAGWRRLDSLSQAQYAANGIPAAIGFAALVAVAASMTDVPERSLDHVQTALLLFVVALIVWTLLKFVFLNIRARAQSSMDDEDQRPSPTEIITREQPSTIREIFRPRLSRWRALLVLLLTVSSVFIWSNTGRNRIEPPIIALWIVTSLLWALAFAPTKWSILDWMTERIDGWRRIKWRKHGWVALAFLLIMMLGVSFRLTDLDTIPREMTSDHVEKAQDAYRVYTGDYQIFFPNNGGREPFQMYAISLLARLPGLGFNFYTLKFLAVMESIITLPLLFWMGVELLGARPRRFNIAVALLLTALVAVSYWHVTISRQGLRIPLTPPVTALLLIYLARAMRHNRRGDFVKAAVVLGFGLYMYQAVRMLPIVIVAGLFFAVVLRKITWRERGRYLLHLLVLIFVSLMIFLPMLRFWADFPNQFWMRTSTRILGDYMGYATAEEAEAALQTNVFQLMRNIRDALLMYNWKGDIGWFNGAPEHPVMDIYTGAFLILGAAAWLARMLKSRDPVVWFLPMVLLIMLMPTALSIAHPEANPSNSRALGTVPVVYLLAALPLGMLARHILRAIPRRAGLILAAVFCGCIVLLANQRNTDVYFNRYATGYNGSTWPHSEAGRLVRGFADSDGAIGNVFSMGYAFWWDFRALGIEAGYPMWPNDGSPIDFLPHKLMEGLRRTDEFRINPERDMIFLHNLDDANTRALLGEWFPDGREMIVQSYQPEDRFALYRVPALGADGWQAFLERHNIGF